MYISLLRLGVGWTSSRVIVPLSEWGGELDWILVFFFTFCQGEWEANIRVRGVRQASQVSWNNGLASHEHEFVKPPDYKCRNSAEEL